MLLISVLKTMPSESSTNQAPSNEKPNVPAHPYSEFSDGRRRLVLSIVAVAGFFGPLAAGVYLPALPILVEEFNTSESTINATVSVFMVILAVAVSRKAPSNMWFQTEDLTITAVVLGI